MIAHPVTTIVNVSVLAIILTYVSAMKVKCGYCTNIPETQYVTVLTTVIMVEVLFVALFPNQAKQFFMSNPWAIFILIVINVANIIFLYRFIFQMNESQCRQCTSEWRRTFLYYYSTFILILYAINIVLMVVALVVLSGMSRSELSKVTKMRIKNRK
jgi:hypothetical protein